jgi:hypothetical protein
MRRYDATPETFFYRLTQLCRGSSACGDLLHAVQPVGEDRLAGPDQVFNLSRVPVPHGVGSAETYRRRWRSLRLFADGKARQAPPPAPS